MLPSEIAALFAVNFSALSDDLVESELFGYEDGAFTGAKRAEKWDYLNKQMVALFFR